MPKRKLRQRKIRSLKVFKPRHDHPALQLMQPQSEEHWRVIHFDGSCDHNGYAYATGKWAWVYLNPDGDVLKYDSGEVESDLVTCNVSEWVAIRNAIKSLEPNFAGLLIHGDSDLVIRCLTGRWASKNERLTRLRDETLDLLHQLGRPWCAKWVPRRENEIADQLTR